MARCSSLCCLVRGHTRTFSAAHPRQYLARRLSPRHNLKRYTALLKGAHAAARMTRYIGCSGFHYDASRPEDQFQVMVRWFWWIMQ